VQNDLERGLATGDPLGTEAEPDDEFPNHDGEETGEVEEQSDDTDTVVSDVDDPAEDSAAPSTRPMNADDEDEIRTEENPGPETTE
jgi:hypothetical protein